MKMKYAGWAAVVTAAILLNGCGSDSKVNGGAGRTGEATISIAPYGSPTASSIGGCIQYFVVHGIDDNGVAIPHLNVKARMIVDPKVGGNNGIVFIDDSTVKFKDPTQNFESLRITRENNLIIRPLPARAHPSYVGDWGIYSVFGDTLVLTDPAYNVTPTDGLSYYVGDERAFVKGKFAVAHIDNLKDGNGTVMTEDGYTYFAIAYDEVLGEKNIPFVVGAHIEGYRVGNIYEGRFADCAEIEDINVTAETNSTS